MAQPHTQSELTIDRLFKSEFGEVRLIVKGLNAVEAKTLYTLCKIGMQAALDDAIHEVEDEAPGTVSDHS